MKKHFKLLSAFAKDRRGSIGVIFGLALLPTMMMVGAAIDYAGAGRGKSALQAAADAAVVAAAKSYVDNAPLRARSTDYEQVRNAANQTGQAVFQSNVPSNVENAAINIVTTRASGTITSTATYSGTARVHFSKLMGVNQIALSGTAQATQESPYRSIFVFIDNTHSMSVGATLADRNKLASLTRPSCVFACHGVTSDNVNAGQFVSNTSIAETNGVKLRIDVVKDGVLRLINTVKTSALAGKAYIDIFRVDFSSVFWTENFDLVDLTNDYSRLEQAANQIGGTPIDAFPTMSGRTIMRDFSEESNSRVRGVIEGGSNTVEGQKYVLFITDGIDNRPVLPIVSYCYNSSLALCAGQFNPALCDNLKGKGVTYAVIHMPYVTLTGDPIYNASVANVAGQIESNLRSCASPGFYFKADTSLNAAIDAFLNKVKMTSLPAPRLTQ